MQSQWRASTVEHLAAERIKKGKEKKNSEH